jgi:hypothetical protein
MFCYSGTTNLDENVHLEPQPNDQEIIQVSETKTPFWRANY